MGVDVTMEYTIHEQKVYTNKCLEVEERVKLDALVGKRDELVGLLDLFIEGGNHRLERAENVRGGIMDIFAPKIREAKRTLANTTKRLEYNYKRA